jgi:hypothetical protein
MAMYGRKALGEDGSEKIVFALQFESDMLWCPPYCIMLLLIDDKNLLELGCILGKG